MARDTQGRPPERTAAIRHLHDDDLVLYHYGEIRTAPAQGHLRICRGCRDRLQTLTLDLERLSLAPPPPATASRTAPQSPSRRPRLAVWRRLLLRLAYAGTDRQGSSRDSGTIPVSVGLLSGLIAVLALAAPADKPAANLIANGSFIGNVTGWKASGSDSNSETGGLAWSRLDAGAAKGSGSLDLVTSATADRDSFRVGQCVRIESGVENLLFGGRIRVPTGQKARGIANLEFERFETADCSGPVVPFEGLGGITNADFWATRQELVAAAGARSVRLVALVTKYYEWKEGDEIGEADDGNPFRAGFDDLFVRVLEKNPPAGREPLPAEPSRFTPAAAPPKKARWGANVVLPPVLTLAVRDAEGHPHPAGVVAECSSLNAVQLEVNLKSPYADDDPRFYPLEPVSLAGEGGLGPRPTVEIGMFVAGDRQRRLVPIACSGPPVELRVLGDRNQRVGGIRAFYDCLRTALPRETRARAPERPSDEDLLGWTLAGSIIANPAGEYEIVARYRALEAGFWHEPVLSNPVKIRIVRKEPCPEPTGSR